MDSKQKILIVDDREANLLALEQTLREVPADLVRATSGNAALAAALEQDFALAILDVQMPEMDGYELASLLRSDEKSALLPIIFLTAFYGAEDQVFKGYESGAVDYLVKPVEPNILLAKVGVFLDLDRQRRVLQSERANLERRVAERTQEIEARNEQLQGEIVERRRSEAELRLAGQVLDNMVDGVFVTDTDDNIIRVNPAFTRITGFPPEEVLGKKPRAFASDRHDDRFFAHIREQLRDEGHWSGEIWNRAADGHSYPCWVNMVAIRDESGQVMRHAVSFKDQSREKEYRERLNFMAYYDALTGLPNRELLGNHVGTAIARAKREGSKMALLFLDLDRFKNINDSLGHSVGDALLTFVGNTLKECVRQTDTVARFGGDEFMVIVEEVKALSDASGVAEKILSTFNTTAFIYGDHELFVTFSIGISLYPDNGTDAEALLKLSDTAMYQAKAGGRAAYRFYSDEMNSRFEDRLQLETDLKRGIANDEFFLLYQPQVDIQSGRMIGCEALVRWEHPTKGRVMPDEFISIAEETGLIYSLGEWVLAEAIRCARRWSEINGEALRVAVNFSSMQLHSPYTDELLSLVDASGSARKLCMELEITESVFMKHNQVLLDTLQRFRDRGFTISIDDFGTGYSSLAYLKRLPVDKLKIAQPFVQDIVSDPDSAAIASTIVTLGHSLQMRVIAEGVEDEQQLAFLREEGCDEIQGYLFSEPLRGEDIERLIKQGGDLMAVGKGSGA